MLLHVFNRPARCVLFHTYCPRCQFGYSCLGCIDDSFYTKDTLHRFQEATLHAVQLFIKLVFVVHPTKSVFQPTQSLGFLAFVLDSILMRAAITKVIRLTIYWLCWQYIGFVPLFSRQQIVHYSPRSLPYRNSCVHFFPELNWGPCIRLLRDKDIVLRDSLDYFEGFMSLSPESMGNLNWWVDALPSTDRSIDMVCQF